MTEHVCQGPNCGRTYNTRKDGGTATFCGKCYARNRRGGLKRKPDPNRGARTVAMQVWMTPEDHAKVVQAFPRPGQRGEWVRGLMLRELEVRALQARLLRWVYK